MIEVACDANITWSFITSEARQFGAMREMVDKHGVKIHFWSEDILSKMRVGAARAHGESRGGLGDAGTPYPCQGDTMRAHGGLPCHERLDRLAAVRSSCH